MPISRLESRYCVSNKGRVKSLAFSTVRNNGRPYHQKERILKPGKTMKHEYVMLYVAPKKQQKFRVHRLVLESFGIKQTSPAHEVNHKDGNPENNRLENLEWVTRKQNIEHAIKNKLFYRGEDSPHAILTVETVKEARKIYAKGGISFRLLAKRFNVAKQTIRSAINRTTWKDVI